MKTKLLALLVGVLSVACSEQVEAVRVEIHYCADQTQDKCTSSVDGYENWAEMFFPSNTGYSPHPDTFCQVTTKKKGSFNTMDVYLSTDENFESTVYEGNRIANVVYQNEGTVGIGCLDSGTKLFVKICRHKADKTMGLSQTYDACTQVHSFTLPDGADHTKLDARGYRTPQVSVIGQSVSLAGSAIGGLQLGYSCSTNELLAKNQVAEGIYFTIDNPSDGTVYVKREYLKADEAASYKATIKEGTGLRVQVWSSSWIGGVVDLITRKPASSIGFFTLGCAGTMEVTASNSSDTAVQLPSVMGVETTLFAGLSTANGTQLASDTLEVKNVSVDSVKWQLIPLSPNPATAGTFLYDLPIGEKCVSGNEDAIIQLPNPIVPGNYAVVIRSCYYNTSWSQNQVSGFVLNKPADKWVVTEISDSLLPKSAP